MTSRSTKERWKQRGGWWERGHVLDKGWYESAIGNSGRKVVVAVVVQWEADERVEVSVVVPRRRGIGGGGGTERRRMVENREHARQDGEERAIGTECKCKVVRIVHVYMYMKTVN